MMCDYTYTMTINGKSTMLCYYKFLLLLKARFQKGKVIITGQLSIRDILREG